MVNCSLYFSFKEEGGKKADPSPHGKSIEKYVAKGSLEFKGVRAKGFKRVPDEASKGVRYVHAHVY